MKDHDETQAGSWLRTGVIVYTAVSFAVGSTLALAQQAPSPSPTPRPVPRLDPGPEAGAKPARDATERLSRDEVLIDLRSGQILGSHTAISMVQPPRDSDRDGMREAVVKVNLKGYRHLEVVADYDAAPTGFSLNVGDSRTNNGYAGDAATQSNDAELEVRGDTLCAWGNDDVPTSQRKLAEWKGAVHAKTRLRLRVGDGELAWEAERDGQTVADACRSQNLFALDGQPDREGPVNFDLFLGLNKVVSGGRRGSGLAKVRLRLVR